LEHIDPDSLKLHRWGSPSDVEATKLIFRKGDIIFGRRRVYQRKVAVAEFDGICSAHALVLRAKPEIVLPEFLPFFMQSDQFMERAKTISIGSLSPTINWKTLAGEKFEIPSLIEQERICKRLIALEDLIIFYEKALHSASKARKSLSLSLFNEDQKKHVEKLRKLILDSRYGPRFSSALYDENGSIGQIRTTDMDDDGNIDYLSVPKANLDIQDYEEHLLKDGDIVISRSGTCGITAIFSPQSEPIIPGAFLIRLRPNKKISSEYLHEYFSSPLGRQLTASLARGGVQKNISGSELLAREVPCPDAERQKDVVVKLQDLKEAEKGLSERKFSLQTMKKLFLHSVVGDTV
jgi:restriction endonuclease S subunit